MSVISRRPAPRARRDADRGAVAILVAVFMLLAMGLVAIVVDLGFARDRARLAQNAADAAAIAAAQSIVQAADPLAPTGAEQQAARDRAGQFLTANGWTNGAAISFDLTRYVVRVALTPQPSPSFFAGILGTPPPTVARAAGARWADPSPGDCSVCVFGDIQAQNGDLFVTNGDVRVGGVITTKNNGHVIDTGGALHAGNVAGSETNPLNASPQPVRQQTGPVPDPFLNVPDPLVGQNVAPSPGPNCSPGTYGSVDNCETFAPGVYVVTAASKWTGNTGAKGTGVLFYLTCASGGRSARCASTGQVGGSLSSNGGGKLQLDFAPIADPQYKGLVVFGDRNNTAENDIQGGSLFSTGSGSVYMKRGSLTHGGNPALTIGGSVVVGQYASNGNKNPATVTGKPTKAPPTASADVIGLVD